MKKIMILTAERTGTGHKSAANVLEKRLNNLGYETKQIDCFDMLNKSGELLENSYIPITTRAPLLFQIPYTFSQASPNSIHNSIYLKSRKSFKKEFSEFKPDLIISVHSMFTKAISRLIKEENMNIPFFIDVIDLINPPNLWYDENADFTFVPTEEIKENYLKNGYDKNKIMVSGFPIREDIPSRKTPKKVTNKINILLVNPSVYLQKNIEYVKEVSKIENANITIVCGRDRRMYNALVKEQNLGRISNDVNIFSFINNMNELLENAHILLTKAGPNMMLEGIKSRTAIVVTGHIHGQENNNYEYITKNKYGFKCENPKEIYTKLDEFIKSGELDNCLENVMHDTCTNGGEIITNYIKNHI